MLPYLHWRFGVLSTYKLCLYLGAAAALPLASAGARREGLEPASVLATIPVLLAVAFVGARLLFLLEHRSVSWSPSAGGACLWGGVLAALAVSIPLLAVLGLSPGRYWDALVPSLLVFRICGLVGCTLHGCCSGRRTCSRFGLPRREPDGSVTRRVPTQLLEAAVTGLLAVLVIADVGRTLSDGGRFVLALCVFAAARSLMGLLREPARERRARVIARLLPVAVALSAGAALLFAAGGRW